MFSIFIIILFEKEIINFDNYLTSIGISLNDYLVNIIITEFKVN